MEKNEKDHSASLAEDVSAGSIAPDAATARHTKGLWMVSGDRSDPAIVTQGSRLCIALVTGGLDSVQEFGIFGPTARANAHLIAAAPEMYAVLKSMMTSVECCSVCGCYPHEEGCAVLAALAKAEGK